MNNQDLQDLNELLDGRYATASKITARPAEVLKNGRTKNADGTKNPTPEKYANAVIYRGETVILDHEYAKRVAERAKENGEEYEAGKTHYTTDGVIGTSKKDPNRKYLVYSQNVHTFKEGRFFKAIDGEGNDFTDKHEEIRDEYFKSGFDKEFTSKKQIEECGIDESKLVNQKINKAENVIYLSGSTTDQREDNDLEKETFKFSDEEELKKAGIVRK